MSITSSDIKKIMELKKQGFTAEEIAAMYSITPRRVYQILHTKQVKKRGRPPTELDPAVISKIVSLRMRGFSISKIQRTLEEEGISLSRYLVWKVIKAHLNCNTKEECRIKYEMKRRINYISRKFRILYIDLLRTKLKNRKVTLLLIMDVTDCKVLELTPISDITLKAIISRLEGKYLKTFNPETLFLTIYPIPPLAPTKTKRNKLVKFLEKNGVRYIWATGTLGKDIKECRSKLSRKVFKQLNEESRNKTLGEILEYGKRIISEECKKLLHEDENIPRGENMRLQVFDRLRVLLNGKKEPEGIQNNIENLMKRYMFKRVLYATSEGLPILGTFEETDLLAARVPELLKMLNNVEPSPIYIIKISNSHMFFIVNITPEVILFAEGMKELSQNEIQRLIEDTKSYLGL